MWQKESSNLQSIFFDLFNGFFSTFGMTDTTQTAAMTESSQTAGIPVSDSSVHPPRVPHTHTSPAITHMLKNLPLISVLQMNKDIEVKNAE